MYGLSLRAPSISIASLFLARPSVTKAFTSRPQDKAISTALLKIFAKSPAHNFLLVNQKAMGIFHVPYIDRIMATKISSAVSSLLSPSAKSTNPTTSSVSGLMRGSML